MAKKINKSSNQYKEDIIFFRMSMLFLLTCAAVMGIFKLGSGKAALQFFRVVRNPIYIVIVLVLLAGSLIYMYLNKKNKTDESLKSFSSMNFVSIMAYITGVSFYWGYTSSPSTRFILAVTICLPLLYFIYHIYKKDFFVFSLSNFVFLCALWAFSLASIKSAILSALLVGVSAACCVVSYNCSKKFAGNKDYKYRFELIPISFVITMALIVFDYFITVPFITTSAISTIMLFQYIAGGIYYTVKLIREA